MSKKFKNCVKVRFEKNTIVLNLIKLETIM